MHCNSKQQGGRGRCGDEAKDDPQASITSKANFDENEIFKGIVKISNSIAMLFTSMLVQ